MNIINFAARAALSFSLGTGPVYAQNAPNTVGTGEIPAGNNTLYLPDRGEDSFVRLGNHFAYGGNVYVQASIMGTIQGEMFENYSPTEVMNAVKTAKYFRSLLYQKGYISTEEFTIEIKDETYGESWQERNGNSNGVVVINGTEIPNTPGFDVDTLTEATTALTVDINLGTNSPSEQAPEPRDFRTETSAVHSIIEELLHNEQNRRFEAAVEELGNVHHRLDNEIKEHLVQIEVKAVMRDLINQGILDIPIEYVLLPTSKNVQNTHESSYSTFHNVDSNGLSKSAFFSKPNPYTTGQTMFLSFKEEPVWSVTDRYFNYIKSLPSGQELTLDSFYEAQGVDFQQAFIDGSSTLQQLAFQNQDARYTPIALPESDIVYVTNEYFNFEDPDDVGFPRLPGSMPSAPIVAYGTKQITGTGAVYVLSNDGVPPLKIDLSDQPAEIYDGMPFMIDGQATITSDNQLAIPVIAPDDIGISDPDKVEQGGYLVVPQTGQTFQHMVYYKGIQYAFVNARGAMNNTRAFAIPGTMALDPDSLEQYSMPVNIHLDRFSTDWYYGQNGPK